MLPLIVRIDADDTRSAEMLKQDGWREGDELTTYVRCNDRVHDPVAKVRKAREKDKWSVVEIANKAFAPKDKSVWVFEAFERSDRAILVHDDGEVDGFVILRQERETTVIDLIGVGNYRNGVGRALMNAVEHFTRPFSWIQAGTQTTNETAQKFYVSLGFHVKHRRRTFHKP